MSVALRHRTGWRPAVLRDLVFFQRGFDITKAEQKPGSIPVVSSSGVNSYHSEAKVDGPGVVIGRKGSLGTVHYVDGPYWPHDTTLWSKDLMGNLPRFVYYFLKTLGLERYDVGNSNPTLNRNHIHRLDILLPDYRIQERIVEFLSAYDDLIENNRQRIRLLEQAAWLLYKEWFVHLRFPGHEHVKVTNGVPEGWEKSCVARLANVQSGFAFKSKDWQPYGNPVIKIKNIVGDGTIDTSNCDCVNDAVAETAISFVIPAGSLLIAMTGATVGKVGIMPDSSRKFFLNQRVGLFKTNLGYPSERFLYPFFQGEFAQAQVQNLAGGAAQANISGKQIEGIELLIPDKKILNFYLDAADGIFQQRQNLLHQNVKLTQASDLLLPKLMNGEVAV